MTLGAHEEALSVPLPSLGPAHPEPPSSLCSPQQRPLVTLTERGPPRAPSPCGLMCSLHEMLRGPLWPVHQTGSRGASDSPPLTSLPPWPPPCLSLLTWPHPQLLCD